MSDLGKLIFKSIGRGTPILFVHGWTLSGSAEAHDFEQIFDHDHAHRRIYVDLPGMGETPAGDIQNLDDIYDALVTFVKTNLAHSPFLLVGTSCGAYLARALAFQFEEYVQGLLLRVPLIEPDSSKRKIGQIEPAVRNEHVMKNAAGDADLANVPVQTEEYIDKFRTKMDRVIMPAVRAADDAALSPIRGDPKKYFLNKSFHDEQHRFVKPTLILTGRQDGVVGFEDAWKILSAYPRASFVLLDRADHGFPVDEQSLFKQLILDWLKRVQESQ